MLRVADRQLRYVAALVAVLVVGGAGLALANHDPNIVHICAKQRHLELAGHSGDCKAGWTSIGLATEESLAALQGSNQDLQTKVAALEALVRRLHGHNAAVIDRGLSGEAPGNPGGFRITLTFCGTGMIDCRSLTSGLITESEEGSVVTFNATTNPVDFPVIAERLSNDVDDFIEIKTDYFDADDNFAGGGAGSGPESGRFFRTPQTTTGPGFVDLAGLEIGSIDLTIDIVSLFFNNTGNTEHNLDYRVFFSLAD